MHAGDTLQSMASTYYGSSSYWYLIADANGLTGTETLKEGTTLTIPNRVTNSFNTFDTFRPYSTNDILGNTTPGLRFKMGTYQSWERAVVTIVSIIVMVVVAIYAPELLRVVGGLLAGFFIGYAVSVAGQSSNVDAGLQTKVDYKQARKMGYSLAISVLAADFLSWAKTGVTAAGTATGDAMTVAADATTAEEAASAANNIANAMQAENAANQLYQVERVAIEAGKQMLQNHGKITSVTGLVGAYFGADVSSGWGAVGMAGLNLAETYSRNKHQLNNLDWMHFATSAVGGYYGSTYDSNGVANGTQGYFHDAQGNNSFNWAMLAREAAFTGLNAFAASRVKGEQDLVGNEIANGIGRIAGNVLAQSPGFHSLLQTASAPLNRLDRAVTGFIGTTASALTEQVSGGLDAMASAFGVNTAGDSLNNSALAQASGAEGSNGVIVGSAAWQEPIVGTSLAMEPSGNNAATLYVTKSGDSLWAVSKQQLADQGLPTDNASVATQVQRNFDANPTLRDSKDPNFLPVDQLLNLASVNAMPSQAAQGALVRADMMNQPRGQVFLGEPTAVLDDGISTVPSSENQANATAVGDKIKGGIKAPKTDARYLTLGAGGGETNLYQDKETGRFVRNPFKDLADYTDAVGQGRMDKAPQPPVSKSFGYGLEIKVETDLVTYKNSYTTDSGVTFENGAAVTAGLTLDKEGISAKFSANALAQTQYVKGETATTIGTFSGSVQTVGEVGGEANLTLTPGRQMDVSAKFKAQMVAMQYRGEYESSQVELGAFSFQVKSQGEFNVVGVGAQAQFGVTETKTDSWKLTAGVGLTPVIGGNAKFSLDVSLNRDWVSQQYDLVRMQYYSLFR